MSFDLDTSFRHKNTTSIILRMAYVLARWPEPTIQRSTLRTFLPSVPREDKNKKSKVSKKFQTRLVDFERAGLIAREGDRVRITNRAGLAGYGSLLDSEFAVMLRLALAEVRAEPAMDPEVRRRELLSIQQLMQSAPGSNGGGRGAVRLLPRSKTL